MKHLILVYIFLKSFVIGPVGAFEGRVATELIAQPVLVLWKKRREPCFWVRLFHDVSHTLARRGYKLIAFIARLGQLALVLDQKIAGRLCGFGLALLLQKRWVY